MKARALYLRSIIFGITDSLVSTVGLLAGIDIAGAPHSTLALTGLVYAFVEAFSMAVGNFLSEQSVEEYTTRAEVASVSSALAAVVMFVSFVLASLIPLTPYLLFNAEAYAGWVAPTVSVIVSIVALFMLGMMSARLSHLPALSRGFRMALLGGSAILIGAVVGMIVPVA